MVDAIKVRGRGRSGAGSKSPSPFEKLDRVGKASIILPVVLTQDVYIEGSWRSLPVYKLGNLDAGSVVEVMPGPNYVS